MILKIYIEKCTPEARHRKVHRMQLYNEILENANYSVQKQKSGCSSGGQMAAMGQKELFGEDGNVLCVVVVICRVYVHNSSNTLLYYIL